MDKTKLSSCFVKDIMENTEKYKIVHKLTLMRK